MKGSRYKYQPLDLGRSFYDFPRRKTTSAPQRVLCANDIHSTFLSYIRGAWEYMFGQTVDSQLVVVGIDLCTFTI